MHIQPAVNIHKSSVYCVSVTGTNANVAATMGGRGAVITTNDGGGDGVVDGGRARARA